MEARRGLHARARVAGARTRGDARGPRRVLRALLLRRLHQRHQVVAGAGRPALPAHLWACLPGGVPTPAVRRLEPDDARPAIPRCSATGSSCCAATRASWWRAATWRTSTRRHGLGSSVRVVSLPVESPRPRAAASEPADDPRRPWRLLFLGRFESTKGVDMALESAAIAASTTSREVHLQLSGEGSRRSRLAARAAALMGQRANLRVEMTPWLSSDAAADALDHADLLLVPSLWPEPFGMVGVEAARRGVPSVAFAVGGIPEWLIDGATGTLVPAAAGHGGGVRGGHHGDALERRCLARDASRVSRRRAAVRRGHAPAGSRRGVRRGQRRLGVRGMSLRVLLAIHGPANPRTAVYRAASTNADYLRRAGHEADLLAADDLRWASLGSIPSSCRRRSRCGGCPATTLWCSTATWATPFTRCARRSTLGGASPRSRRSTGSSRLYFRALADEATSAGQPLSARYRWVHGAIMPRLLRATCRASDAIFCKNSTEASYLVAEGWATGDRVKVMPNGVEPESIPRSPRASAGVRAAFRRAVAAGQGSRLSGAGLYGFGGAGRCPADLRRDGRAA